LASGDSLEKPRLKSGAKDARTPDAVAQIRGAIAGAERLEGGAFTTAFGVELSRPSRFRVPARDVMVMEAPQQPAKEPLPVREIPEPE